MILLYMLLILVLKSNGGGKKPPKGISSLRDIEKLCRTDIRYMYLLDDIYLLNEYEKAVGLNKTEFVYGKGRRKSIFSGSMKKWRVIL